MSPVSAASTNRQWADSCQRNAERVVTLSSYAKLAYDTYSHRAGRVDYIPFEALSPIVQQAWAEVAETIIGLGDDETPQCSTCAEYLVCVKCDAVECPECGEDLECFDCRHKAYQDLKTGEREGAD